MEDAWTTLSEEYGDPKDVTKDGLTFLKNLQLSAKTEAGKFNEFWLEFTQCNNNLIEVGLLMELSNSIVMSSLVK